MVALVIHYCVEVGQVYPRLIIFPFFDASPSEQRQERVGYLDHP